jgi:O-acetyl-ADP-ribose deacetylase (regulator of RNase III)
MNSRIKVIQQDITTLRVDAIVNAANSSLLGGGGVDGAIHRAAGPKLLDYCRQLNGCPTGQAKSSPGFELPAKHVIHTVGPIWRGGKNKEAQLLANCYRNSLKIASDQQFKTVAFPNISTGVYGYPKEAAAEIAFRSVIDFLEHHVYPHKVWFVVFDEENWTIYSQLWQE